MKGLNVVTIALLIVGGLNWLTMAIAKLDMVATIFGGPDTIAARIVYGLVGLSAIAQLWPSSASVRGGDRSTTAASEAKR